ncbi:hypothetical protein [Salmonirosea aquatica]|uniref:Uncharacterized protein n=1 Tax=Salmonirosea aquatica TaxID=2654236 RepID=A0A7C9F3D1_9BACT|nr:hypothetical protein [Cytophagaceae bacterium SJW1-29]
MENDAFKQLDPDHQAPAYLKEALVSEIDFIRDTLQIVTHFTEGFLGAAINNLSQLVDSEP